MRYNLDILRAIADETRLQILLSLRKKDMNVTELVSIVKKSQPNVSLALRKLEQASLISKSKKGKMIIYRLSRKELLQKILELIHEK